MFSNLGGGTMQNGQMQQNNGGGLFGQPQQQQQQQQQGGGMFGTAPANQSLFGAAPQQQQQGGGLFGNVGGSMGGLGGMLGGGGGTTGMFGQQPAQNQGLMGQQQQQPGGLFGQPASGGLFQSNQPQNAGLFGAPQQQQQPQNNMMTQPAQQGLFGGNPAIGMFGQPQSSAGGGMFGLPAPQQQQQPYQGGGFAQSQPQQQTGLFGQQQSYSGVTVSPTWGAPANNMNTGTYGSVNNNSTVVQSTDDSINDSNMDQSCTRIEDSISQIVWSHQQPRLLAASTWEGKVRIYELVQNIQNMNQQTLQERKIFALEPINTSNFGQANNVPNAILCLDWKPDGQIILVGTGMDNTVRAIQVASGQNVPIGQHNAPVIAVYWIEQIQSVLSVSTDQTFKIWDLNMPGQAKYQLQFQYKPLVADLNYPILIIGFTQEKLLVLDLTQLQLIKNLNYYTSPLGDFSRLTSISLFPNRDGFGIGSVDGRGHMSSIITKSGYNGPNTYDYKNIMTFKAHKLEETAQGGGKAQSYFFPVNAIQFNSRNPKFIMTAGGEGQMIFWDFEAKNKIKTFQFNNNPITAAKISNDRQFLAYALGNDFSKGPEGYNMGYQTKLCVHYIPDNELKCATR